MLFNQTQKGQYGMPRPALGVHSHWSIAGDRAGNVAMHPGNAFRKFTQEQSRSDCPSHAVSGVLQVRHIAFELQKLSPTSDAASFIASAILLLAV
jgi:hypothetical protein